MPQAPGIVCGGGGYEVGVIFLFSSKNEIVKRYLHPVIDFNGISVMNHTHYDGSLVKILRIFHGTTRGSYGMTIGILPCHWEPIGKLTNLFIGFPWVCHCELLMVYPWKLYAPSFVNTS